MSEPAVVTAAAAPGPRWRSLTFLTRGRGAVRLFADHPGRRVAHRVYLEPLQAGELTYRRPSGDAPGRLVSFVPQRVWPGIRGDFERTVQALAFLEALVLCATEEDPQPELFRLLVSLLNRIESEDRPEGARVLATARLLRLAGFAPRLDSCTVCGSAAEERAAFALDVVAGGLVCSRCLAGRSDRSSLPMLSAGARGLLARAFAASSEAQLWRLRAGRGVSAEARGIVERILEASVGSRLRSHGFLAKMRMGTSRRSGGRARMPSGG